MATSLTFGNPLKFGPDSCHNVKSRPTFLHREREREHLKLCMNNMHHRIEWGRTTGSYASKSCHHDGWSNEGPRRRRQFFRFHPNRGGASTPTIFASNYMSYVISHPIVNPISPSHYSLHLTMNLISLSFCRFYLRTLVWGVSAERWYSTTSLTRRLGVTFVLRASSLSFVCCLSGLLVLSWHKL